MTVPLRWIAFLVTLSAAAALGWWAVRDRRTPSAPGAAASETNGVSSAPVIAPPLALSPSTESAPVGVSPVDVPKTDSVFDAIMAALRVGGLAEHDQIANGLFPALVAQDRESAMRLVESLPAGELRSQLLRQLARVWAAADFAGAIDWIAALPDPAERNAAFADACFAVADTNPAEAIEAWDVQQFTADDHVLENLVQSWASRDLPAALAWVMTRPPSLQRDQAVARVAFVLAQTKPADAAAFVLRELPPGPAQTEAAISVLHQWAIMEPDGATAWVERFPEGPLAERARSELVGISAKRAEVR